MGGGTQRGQPAPRPAPHPTPQHGPVCLCVADSDSQCSPTRQSLSLSEGEEQMDRLQQVELVRTTPMSHWKAGTVQAWLEVVMAMPMYVKACAENVKSGKVGPPWGFYPAPQPRPGHTHTPGLQELAEPDSCSSDSSKSLSLQQGS